LELILDYFPNLTSDQKEQFQAIKSLYLEWNNKVNVISRKDMDSFYERHVLHSLSIAKFIQFKAGSKILDVGTGGGFPALPLAIYFPECQFLAVDSIGKKLNVINEISQSIGLKNLVTKHQRVEFIREEFDFITARAVSRTKQLLNWVGDKVKSENNNDLPNGIILLKGGDLLEELKETNKKYALVNISDYYDLPFFETKKIVYLQTE